MCYRSNLELCCIPKKHAAHYKGKLQTVAFLCNGAFNSVAHVDFVRWKRSQSFVYFDTVMKEHYSHLKSGSLFTTQIFLAVKAVKATETTTKP